ncbi:MAG: phosphoglycerate dehydrogenase, partial [Microbacterium gubbeenense]
MKILVPDMVEFLDDVDPRAEVALYDPAVPIPDEHRDAEVFVAWGNNADNLASAVQLPNLRFVQALSA